MVFLCDTQCAYFEADECKFTGVVTSGMMRIVRSGVTSTMAFHRAADILYVYLPVDLVRDVRLRAVGGDADNDDPPGPGGMFRDNVIENLARSIQDGGTNEGYFAQRYAESIGSAIAARLLAAGEAEKDRSAGSKGLAPWRMTRVIEFIECNLAKPICLADVSAVSGLSRMHFAAQFRLTTGLRPHEYLLRRRIERAKQLLCESNPAVIDVARRVGFRNSAHFTTVFKRLVGETPHRWRATRAVGP
jgi:AraC family transcriptional regulator